MMSIDVFGRHLNDASKVIIVREPSEIEFKLTPDNQYDIDGRRLCNIALPNNNHNVVTPKSIQSMRNQVDENSESLRI